MLVLSEAPPIVENLRIRPCDAHPLLLTLFSAGGERPGHADSRPLPPLGRRRPPRDGHHMRPNCPSGIVFDGYRNKWRQEEMIDGIRVLRIWTYLSPNKGLLKRVANYVSYLVSATLRAASARNVDVIVATSPQFFCGWAGVVCSWLLRRPFLLEVRDIWPESIVTVGAIKSPARPGYWNGWNAACTPRPGGL